MIIDEIHGICGPKCTACPAHKATLSGDPRELQKVAKEWTESMGRDFTSEEVVCDGCRVTGGRKSAYWHTCDIKVCADQRGVDICAMCELCACERIVAPPAREALEEIKLLLTEEG